MIIVRGGGLKSIKQLGDAIERVDKKVSKEDQKKIERIKKYRKEVSRKASMANKRLKRLEESGMESSPAYQKWLDDGGEYFSVRGKTYNEVQSEMARVNQYLDCATSSITGAKKVLKEMIDNTGRDIEFSDFEELQDEMKSYFEVASQIEQYMRTVEDRASNIGYQKIWEAINRYVEDTETVLSDATTDIESVSADVIKAMRVWEDEDKFSASGEGFEYWNWSTLSKD